LSFHSVNLSTGFHVGSLTISPISVGTGALILVLGLGGSHILQRWVDQRYLPVTGWDTGVRNSVSTGVGYLGVGIALLAALAAAGLGFKQIALVASALSVGIGFGLQQIVQNFVSGLILLVERPVKVGDWVNLGGVEGDVRRIRVRATEIQTFDRTTLIVPNSDLITKQVQNKSLGDPYGRAQLDFSIGAARDAPRTAKVVEAIMAAEPDVLSDPAPVVLIDSITPEGAVNYKCFAYVTSPRIAARIKSRLYIALIEALSEAKIGFVGGPTAVVLEPGPELQSMLQTLSGGSAKPVP
jgi:small-conductance mechanosensitive channel